MPVRVIYRVGNRPENTRVDFESDTAVFKGRKEKCFFFIMAIKCLWSATFLTARSET